MRRQGHLFEQIASFENLLIAARKALRGKCQRRAVAAFLFRLEPELLSLEAELRDGSYRPRAYRTFSVYEPKKRRICAADVRDRVVHHAICNVLDPFFEASTIADSYACRPGKGTHRAVRRAQEFTRSQSYFLKLDVEKFFENVDHATLKGLLRRKFKDGRLLQLLGMIIDHPIPGGAPGKGLPIGNLTSQHFANFYLGAVDHFVKDDLGVRCYLRYMDDLLAFADAKPVLHTLQSGIGTFLRDRLLLSLKDRATLIAPVSQGVSFLGTRIYRRTIRLQRKGWTRFRRKLKALDADYRAGTITEEHRVRSAQSLLGHVQWANTAALRRRYFEEARA